PMRRSAATTVRSRSRIYRPARGSFRSGRRPSVPWRPSRSGRKASSSSRSSPATTTWAWSKSVPACSRSNLFSEASNMDSRMTIAARSDRRLATCALLALGAMAIAGGCSTQVDPPQFRMNMQDILQEAVESHSPDEFRVVGNEEESDKEDKLANIAKLETLTTLTVAAFGEP